MSKYRRAYVRRFIYTLTVSDSIHPNIGPLQQPGRYKAPAMLQRVPVPNHDDFIRRLNTKHVIVYEGPLYHENLVSLRGDPHTLDLQQIGRDVASELERAENVSYAARGPVPGESRSVPCNMSQGDVKVIWGTLYAGLIISTLSNPYSQISMTYLPYMVTVRDKIYATFIDLFALIRQSTDRLPLVDIRSPNNTQAFSWDIFRLYSSRPVNFQLLPIVSQSVAKFLNDKLESSNLSVIVRFADPDLDNASTISLIFELAINNETIQVLDSRLFYGKQMYDHLEGLRISLGTSTESDAGGNTVQLSAQPFTEAANPQRQKFLQNCEYGQMQIPEDMATAPYQSSSACICPRQTSTGDIVRLVEEAFAEANPVTLNEAYFVLSLKQREEIFRDARGHRIVRFIFAFSFFNLPSGKFWNVWRYPTDAILRKLSEFNPPVTIGHFLHEQAPSDMVMHESKSNTITNKETKGAGLSPDVDAVLANATISLYLVKNGLSIQTQEQYDHDRITEWVSFGEKTEALLRAVSTAFTEANSVENHANLTVILVGCDDDLATLNGIQVTKCDFTLAFRDDRPDHSGTQWRYPSRKVLQKHLRETASVLLTDDPIY